MTDLTPLRSARSLRVLRLDETGGRPTTRPLEDLKALEELEQTIGMYPPGLNLTTPFCASCPDSVAS